MLFRQKLVLGSTSTLKKRFSNALYTIIFIGVREGILLGWAAKICPENNNLP